MRSCGFIQIIRRCFLAAKQGNWNLLLCRWCAILWYQSAFLLAGNCPKGCKCLCRSLLCLHLHPGEKGLSLLLLLQWTNGTFPSWSFCYCSWLCLVALVFHTIRVSGCFWIISMVCICCQLFWLIRKLALQIFISNRVKKNPLPP